MERRRRLLESILIEDSERQLMFMEINSTRITENTEEAERELRNLIFTERENNIGQKQF